MATEEYSIGYEQGKQDGFNEAMTQQRTWVGLTKDQMLEILKEIDYETQRLPVGFRMFANAIEARLKELNT
jgi:flagellar biosynthesis/type III secretory pathway protein FliH